jgi:hypothetical protein
MPEQDAVLAMTAGASDMQAILEAAWHTLLPGMGSRATVIKKHQADLRHRIRSLRLDPPAFRDRPGGASGIDGTSWRLEANEARLRSVAFSVRPGKLVMTVRARRSTVLRFGQGKWAAGRARRDRSPVPVPVRGAWTWSSDDTLEATVCYITTPFRETYVCRFAGDSLELTIKANVSFGPPETPVIRGSKEGNTRPEQ